ncbi:hypothetical protein [Undibacterium terreum]|uniref:Curli production assembly/transport component CsgG n=1 Tax=Undibacterium terreum TaxID=1224302 RepID=A0A916UDM8_9BURK|nr:hypothetical protein [Undibacterium terreum]GGC68619.1 hypothetical protein GCM10011396_14580 [Undibacterium terreum]
MLKKLLATGVVCVSALAASFSYAADGADRHYAVLSLIGDNVTVVFDVLSTGSKLDRNETQKIAIANTSLDSAALMAADNVLGKLQPKAKADLMLSNDAGLYRLQGALFGNTADAGTVLDGLKLALKGNPAVTHLILITKHRGDARLKMVDTSIGHGKLEGLGFYVDNRIGVERTDTLESGRGVIAPYAYMTVRLIDVRNWSVIREKNLDNSYTFANAGDRDKSNDAWKALGAEEKAKILKQLIQKTVEQTAAEILADKPA